jgi:hypothetical protein
LPRALFGHQELRKITENKNCLKKETLKGNALAHVTLSCHFIRTYMTYARTAKGAELIELLRTNDLVLISRVEAILTDSGIAVFLADQHMSALEGSLSFLPRRVLVAAEAEARARKALTEAGLGPELRDG